MPCVQACFLGSPPKACHNMTAIAGIDYSTRACHAAIVENKQLRFAKRYDLGADHAGPIQAMLSDLKQRGVTHLYAEAPFFIPARIDKATQKLKQGSNANTLKLHAVASEVRILAALAGITVTLVAPATWQSAILKGVPGETTKARSMWFTAKVWGLATRDNNMADAVCLATYGEALARFQGLIPPALEVT